VSPAARAMVKILANVARRYTEGPAQPAAA